MTGKVSYEVKEREYEAVAVLRDVITVVADEFESSTGFRSEGLDKLRNCATEEVDKAGRLFL